MKSKEYIIPLDGASSASSSPGMSQRKHTPATIPRTKFTSATPLEQRIAINSLRQKLDYEEAEKVCFDKHFPILVMSIPTF